MAELSGDLVTILSSELIAEVMEEYFNRKMYKQKVKVIDLKPSEAGYAFQLAFVKDDEKALLAALNKTIEVVIPTCEHGTAITQPCQACGLKKLDFQHGSNGSRDSKGRYTKKG